MVTRLAIALNLTLAALSASWAVAGADANALAVWVSIEPQADLVERVGGEHVVVRALISAGQSPHAYDPAPRQIAELSEADVYIRIGMPFENTLLDKIRAIAPDLEIDDGHQGIELVPFDSAGDDHDGAPDPHFWLDPMLAKRLASTTCATLTRLDPAHRVQYAGNLEALATELDALDARVAAILAPLRGKAIFVFHPSYGYLVRRYGLIQVAAEHEGKEPTGRRLGELIDRASSAGAQAIFVQPQFSGRAARAIASAIGGQVVELDPLARDYLANLEEMARRIAAAYDRRGTS